MHGYGCEFFFGGKRMEEDDGDGRYGEFSSMSGERRTKRNYQSGEIRYD